MKKLLCLFALFTYQVNAQTSTDRKTIANRRPPDLIYNGTKSVTGEFSEVGWLGFCTATLVAPNVIYTASHCVTTGQKISFAHRGTGKKYSGVCTRHPQYNSRTTYNDWAFCKLDESLPAGTHLAQFQTEKLVAKGDALLLNGFGQPNVASHYWGMTKVASIGEQDIETCGGARLGSGDSGGSVFMATDDRTDSTVRKIVGVNSRASSQCSYLNRTSHPNFISFAKKYETDKGVLLCGVSKDCEKPVEPVDCEDLYDKLGTCMKEAGEKCSKYYLEFKACLK